MPGRIINLECLSRTKGGKKPRACRLAEKGPPLGGAGGRRRGGGGGRCGQKEEGKEGGAAGKQNEKGRGRLSAHHRDFPKEDSVASKFQGANSDRASSLSPRIKAKLTNAKGHGRFPAFERVGRKSKPRKFGEKDTAESSPTGPPAHSEGLLG
ncbi:hypothetical protein KM043_006538 [Ampulex compressa]|nr:hypothetical protein KM043_006538 [Ampulex compressa]